MPKYLQAGIKSGCQRSATNPSVPLGLQIGRDFAGKPLFRTDLPSIDILIAVSSCLWGLSMTAINYITKL